MPKAPSFWHRPSLRATALRPLAWVYGALAQQRQHTTMPIKVKAHVLCIGNVVAGGAGKTPLALAVGEYYARKNIHAFYLTRGYGGAQSGPLRVDPSRHTAAEVGDEALLLAERLPTIIARNRVAGAQAAIAAGATHIIMDDGLQNPALYKDISFLVIDGVYGLGNGYLLPAGPLREPLSAALARVDCVVQVGEGAPIVTDKPYLRARLTPRIRLEAKIIAFAGIGRPEKFLATLREAGGEVVAFYPFADHYRYREQDIAPLLAQAKAENARLITTHKDHVRLPATYRDRVEIMPVTLTWADDAAFFARLDAALR